MQRVILVLFVTILAACAPALPASLPTTATPSATSTLAQLPTATVAEISNTERFWQTSSDSPDGKWHVIYTLWETHWSTPDPNQPWLGYSSIVQIYEVVAKDGHARYLISWHEYEIRGEEPPILIPVLWSDDGGRLYFATKQHASTFPAPFVYDLSMIDLETGLLKRFPNDYNGPFAVSPDEAYVTFFRYYDNQSHVGLHNLLDSTVQEITFEGGDQDYAFWSPDGSLFAFAVHRLTGTGGPYLDLLVYQAENLELLQQCEVEALQILSWEQAQELCQMPGQGG